MAERVRTYVEGTKSKILTVQFTPDSLGLTSATENQTKVAFFFFSLLYFFVLIKPFSFFFFLFFFTTVLELLAEAAQAERAF